ncbi:cell division protein FtsB [Sphingomonas vulcanisoli]|uniref:Cell division protein FtsB n=1 Tax=Sphingomonas vulcanisoli TaxID=1658060 RepID=A0ABX0TS04_9SPHN|nr:septum formation initiator family protein [Sphingomonas vulcanisoli]NIJ08304.1 cell division protein FtsB [Sphingomonas vulcanisoli]
MARRSTLSVIKSAALPAVALFIIADFAGFAVFGPNGLLSLAGYHQQKAAKLATLDALKVQQIKLQHHADLLDPRHVDPDYADELVRHETGQVRPDEVIIPRN